MHYVFVWYYFDLRLEDWDSKEKRAMIYLNFLVFSLAGMCFNS